MSNTEKEFNISLDELHELTTIPYVLKYIPFGKNRGDEFKSLNYNQLSYYSTLDNRNVSFTAKLLLS